MEKRQNLLFISFLLFSLFSTSLQAKLVISKGGVWGLSSTWEGGVVPGPTDSVLINGNTVTSSPETITVAHVKIINYNIHNGNGSDGHLYLNGGKLICSNGFHAAAEGKNSNLVVSVVLTAELEVNGSFLMERLASNQDQNLVQLKIDDFGKVYANNGFRYNYHNSDPGENESEILISSSGLFEVNGLTEFYNYQGADLNVSLYIDAQFNLKNDLKATLNNGGQILFEVNNFADLNIDGKSHLTNNNGSGDIRMDINNWGDLRLKDTLTMETTLDGKRIILAAKNSNCRIYAEKDIKFLTYWANTQEIQFDYSSNFYLSGNLLRPNGFGKVSLSPTATLHLEGTTPQNLPSSVAFGQDSFKITNLVINNSAGLTLEGPLTVTENLNLANGKINTSATNLLVLADGVNITGGNEDNYINGPLKKIGTNNGNPFTFPLGKNGIYAPLTISAVVNSETAFTAEYFRGTPDEYPLGLGLNNISNIEYWDFYNNSPPGFAGAPELVDVTLGWSDADDSGINDLPSLVVALHNEGGSTWLNAGNGGTTGGAAAGQSGTITHESTCPPPCCHSIMTYGSISTSNSLPVDMNSFSVSKVGDLVYIDWTAIASMEMEKFEVERSNDGINFQAIKEVQPTPNVVYNYQAIDAAPETGSNYYRLKMIELQGEVTYSAVSEIRFEKLNKLDIFPNPVEEEFQLMGTEKFTGISHVEVYNQLGARIYSEMHNLEDATTTLSTDDLNISLSGLYFLYITNAENKVSVVSFVKR